MLRDELNISQTELATVMGVNEAAWRLQIDVWQNSVILKPVSRRLSHAPLTQPSAYPHKNGKAGA
jgi:hypothetical protein